jgi:hypothetical protein
VKTLLRDLGVKFSRFESAVEQAHRAVNELT